MKRDVKPDVHMSLKQESKPLPHKMIPNRKEEPSIPKGISNADIYIHKHVHVVIEYPADAKNMTFCTTYAQFACLWTI